MNKENNELKRVVLALGGNLGDVKNNFKFAVKNLALGKFDTVKCSTIYKTRPIDCAPDEDDFLNMVISGVYSGTPQELLALTQTIETAAGRPAIHEINEARELDIDIIIFDDVVMDEHELVIPHPRFKERLFVLVPMAEICGSWLCPGERVTISEYLELFIERRKLNVSEYIEPFEPLF